MQRQVVLGIRRYGPGEFDIMVAIIWSLLISESLIVSETFSMGARTSEVSMWWFRAVGHWVKGLIGWVPLPHCDLCYIPRGLSQYPI